MRLLVIEDDAKIASFISKGLQQEGYSVDCATNGEDGFHLGLTENYDAAIIDIMLPKLDGLSLVERLREKRIRVPVIILSARQSVDDRILGLKKGGDDYLTKPFAFSELVARIQALIRRASGAKEEVVLNVADLCLDIRTRAVQRAGVKIDLQPREFRLLEYLMRNSGRVVTKTRIMENVWNYNFDPGTNVVEASMCRLREKIDRDFDLKLVRTIRSVGYMLTAAEE